MMCGSPEGLPHPALATDGPFPETKEMLGGYYIIECRDADQATAFAARIPVSKHGWIDVRPIVLWHPDIERITALGSAS